MFRKTDLDEIGKKKMIYYFELLPVRPKPKPGESLSSFVIRLAESNKVNSYNELSTKLFSVNSRFKRNSDFDLSPYKFSNCLDAINLGINDVIDLTYQRLVENLGWISRSPLSRRFFSGSIYPSLRYCPICLQENGCYQLIWRLKEIEYCHVHKCKLIDSCPNCGDLLHIFPKAMNLFQCSHCGKDLRLAESQLIADIVDQEKGIYYFTDCLLRRNSEKEFRKRVLAKEIGDTIKVKRIISGYTQDELAKQINRPKSIVYFMEIGELSHFRYSDYFLVFAQLNIDPRLFIDNYSFLEINIEDNVSGENIIYLEDDLFLSKIFIARKTLLHNGIDVTISSLAAILNIEEIELINSDKVRKVLRNFEIITPVDIERVLLNEIPLIWGQLAKGSNCPTVEMIANELGMNEKVLSYFPSVRRLINKVKMDDYGVLRRDRHDINEIMNNLPKIESYLRENGGPLNQSRVFGLLGVSKNCIIQSFPEIHNEIVNMLEQLRIGVKQNYHRSPTSRQLHEECLLEEMNCIRKKLFAHGITESQILISKEMNLSLATLRKYPMVNEVLKDVALTYHKWKKSLPELNLSHLDCKNPAERKEIETKLCDVIVDMEIDSISRGEVLPQIEISKRLNIPVSTLRRFPSIKIVFDDIARLVQPWRVGPEI